MPRKRSDRQQSWDRFGLPEVGKAALTNYNKNVRPYRKRCGARTKSTEDHAPCKNLALAGHERCRLHGAKTPKGDQWGLVQWPNGKAPDAEAKLQAKLKRIERDRRRKERRLAKMTAQERAKYDEWAKYHRPGSKIERSKPRAAKKAEEFQARAKQPERPVSPELAALQAQAAYLEAERDRYRALAQAEQQQNDEGVFS